MKEPSHLQQQAAKFTAAAAILTAFVEKFGEHIPAGVGYAGLGFDNVPELSLSTGHTADDRQRALTLVGEVFGREGWVMEVNYNRTAFNWVRVIDGVKCTINNAEMIQIQETRTPVPPAKFPLQLEAAQ